MNSKSDRYQYANILLLFKTNYPFIITGEDKYNLINNNNNVFIIIMVNYNNL